MVEMEIGLALPQYDFSIAGVDRLPWSLVTEWAQHAERLGFGSLWLADHLFLGIEKYGAPAGDHFGYDPIVGLGALARSTSTVALGTLVLCAQLRPPKVLVEQLRTLNELAGGRLVPGAGAGWYEPEYRAAGIAFERPGVRLAQLAEVLDLIGAAGLPRFAGGKGDRFLDVVASHADAWNTVWAWTIEDYAARSAVLDAACERIGRPSAKVERTVGLFTLVGADADDLARRYRRLQDRTPPGVISDTTLADWRTGRLVGTVEEVRSQLVRWKSLGVTRLIACLGALPFSVSDPDDLDLLASALT